MIRPATLEDCETIAELGEEFFTEAGWQDVAEYRREDCLKSLQFLATNDTGILLVAEEDGEIIGMAGGLVSPLFFNFSHKAAQEFFWWMSPRSGGTLGVRMLDALEHGARALGCSTLTMGLIAILSAGKKGASMRRLLVRRGYRPAEHTWIKRLSQ